MTTKILIADDEAAIRKLIKQTLEHEDEGYEIHEACDGNEAVAMAMEIHPELLILDIMMPGKLGYEVCDDLKGYPGTKDIAILFLSSRGTSLTERTISSSGAVGFMAKPFSPPELSKKVKEALNH